MNIDLGPMQMLISKPLAGKNKLIIDLFKYKSF